MHCGSQVLSTDEEDDLLAQVLAWEGQREEDHSRSRDASAPAPPSKRHRASTYQRASGDMSALSGGGGTYSEVSTGTPAAPRHPAAPAAPRSNNALMREKQNLTKKLQKEKRAADRAS